MSLFSNAEKTAIRQYLGYANLFRYLHYRLEGVFEAVDQDAVNLVRTYLTSLATIDTQLLTSPSGVKRVDDVEFFKSTFLHEQRSVGRMYIGRISTVLGVPIYSDYYGEHGYLGDQYSAGGLGGHGGRKIPLG